MSGLGGDVDFTNQQEVQEYLENLGTEYRFGCYGEKNPKACQLLGEYMESVTRETDKAYKVFETNCLVNNYGPSCSKAGFYKTTGQSTSLDPDLGYKYLLRGCEADYGRSCLLAAFFHITKFKVPLQTEKSLPEAVRLFEKACEMNQELACHHLGAIYLTGRGDIQADKERASKIFEKGCDLGSSQCCFNLSIMYKKGDGVSQDEVLAKKYRDIFEDLKEQMTKQKERIKFQEGVETAGTAPVRA